MSFNSITGKICFKVPSLISAVNSRNLPLLHSALLNDPKAVEQRDSSGRTPLHIAAINKDKAIISELLKFNARPDLKDFQGKSVFDLLKGCKTNASDELIKLLRECVEIRGKCRNSLKKNLKKLTSEIGGEEGKPLKLFAHIREPELAWTDHGWKPKNNPNFPFFVRVNRSRPYRSTGTTRFHNSLCPRGG